MATTEETQDDPDEEERVAAGELAVLATGEGDGIDENGPGDRRGSGEGTEESVAVAEIPKRFAADDGELDATRLYLNEIGASKLLTAEEEVHFSRRAQRGSIPPPTDSVARATIFSPMRRPSPRSPVPPG